MGCGCFVFGRVAAFCIFFKFTRNIDMKKIISVLLCAALTLGIMSGCNAEAVSEGEKEKSMPLEWIEEPQSYEDYLNNAKITSLTQLGNTYRLKKAMDKARAGETVNIAYIGGSITEGDILQPEERYVNRTYNYFKEKFGKGDGENVQFFNAGFRGTGSKLGALRLEDDVLSHQPDIVFVEYAVNDGGDPSDKDGFESIIRTCLEYETQPAVILLFARMDNGGSSQDWKKEIGEYYDVSMISYADGITYLMDNGAMTWAEFSDDYTHPNAHGGEVIAEFINYFYDEADRLPASESDIVIPELMFDGYYVNAHLLTKNNYELTDETKGSWKKGSTGDHFPNGWTKSFSEENEPIVFEFTGKDAYVIHPQAGNQTYGTLVCNVYFNDELVVTKEILEYSEGGWMAAIPVELYHAPEEGEYRIEFTASEDYVKCDLQILAVGYTTVD